jgi:murein DD-endopeptidase MepM/ murein hydrolase activator NlpD
MAESLLERAWAWLHETFPERQVYIRSDGRVQFFTFSPVFQATLAGLGLIFLGWVAFATVNVIFKDRIIAAKDHRFQQTVQNYEIRVADLQTSYEESNGALVTAEDRFKEVADELQTKQNIIWNVLSRKREVDAILNRRDTTGQAAHEVFDGGKPGDALDAAPPPPSAIQSTAGSSDFTVTPQPVKPQPRSAKPTKASMLDFGSTVGRLAGAIFGRRQTADISPEVIARHPVLRQLAFQTERIRRLSASQTMLMARTQGQVEEGITSIRSILKRTGINPDQFAQRVRGSEGVGGPEIPLSAVSIEGVSDTAFQQAYLKSSAQLTEMTELLGGLKHVPLTTPVAGAAFERTSGFGARVDPFTGRYAFHPGVDWSGPTGATVRSTAPGVVVWADYRGGYGKMVEINHGYGIHTRYAHLSSILVHVGTRVGENAPVGKLGSTGRSTGPHVHYEIWYDDVVRNPRNFIEAGRYVLQ